MTLWKKISLGVLIFIILLLGSIGFLIGSTTGLHLLFNGANRWVPGLEIGQVTGGWQDLTLKQVRFTQPGVAVDAGELHLAVQLGCLWHRNLCVNNIALSDVNVVINSSKMPPSEPVAEEDSGPLELSAPLPITLSRVALNNIHLNIDDTAISLLDFTSGLAWKEKDLTLTPTSLQGLLIALPKTVEMAQQEVSEPQTQDPQVEEKPLGETLTALFSKPLLPEMADINLPLNLNVESFHGEQLRLTGDTDMTIYNLLLKASSVDGHIKLDALDIDSDQGKVSSSGTAQLLGDWPVDLTLDSTLNIEPLKGEKVTLKVGGAVRKQLAVDVALSGPVAMGLRAQAQLAETGLPFDLEVNSQQLYWPLTGEKQYQADNLALKLGGKATDYTLAFNTAVKGQGIPPADIALNAQGNERQVNVDKLSVAALAGKTELTALLDWQKAISWRGELTLDNINTAQLAADWPSQLNGLVKTSGSLYGGTWQVKVPEMKITGNVKQNKVDVNGTLHGNSYMQWMIPSLHVALGNNSVDVKGELGVKDLNLDANIDAPKLDHMLPGLGGTAKGLVKVRGTIEAPQLLADLTAQRLRWQDLTIGQVRVDGDVKSSAQIAGDLDVRVDRIAQPGLDIGFLHLAAKGDEKHHALQLQVQGEPVSGQLALAGSFDRAEERWKGTLSNTRFQTPVGALATNRDVALDYRNREQKISIGSHCWVNPNAELCIPQTIDAGAEGRARVELKRFDLAMIKPFLPKGTRLDGIFNGNADVAWDATKPGLPQGKVALSGRNVKVRQVVNNARLPIDFDTLNVNTDLHNNQAELGWLIRLTNNGQLDGKVQVSDPQGKRNLGGNVNIRDFSLAMINPIFAKGEKADGKLNANLRLAGNAQNPLLFGQLQLNSLDVDGNFMPFDMLPSQLAVNFNGTHSTLQGLIRTQQGQISLNGDADWQQIDNWRARIAAKGSRVRISVPPMVRVDVSPDIEFNAMPSLFTLNGNVDVPWARIVVQQVPESAVGVSSDEVILNEQLQPKEPPSVPIAINSNLNIHIGNNVRLEAFGLKAKLTGDVKVAQDNKGLGLHGQITIPDGRFHAYGQDLIVRKGELSFTGPPAQPLLNIEAIRNPEATENDVIAGVRVTGTADRPEAEVFSDPAMSQQEALSYLVRGQGLDSEQSDSDAMTSMLVGVGIAQSGQVMGKIGETFGVSNLALDTQGVGDSSQVVVSGYVLPGLQVKYGVGIFDSLATLTLRYRLMPKLYLEAVSGIDQALDLLYQFEF